MKISIEIFQLDKIKVYLCVFLSAFFGLKFQKRFRAGIYNLSRFKIQNLIFTLKIQKIQKNTPKIEIQNHHIETENGKTITFEDLIRIKDLGLKCVLFIVEDKKNL